MLFSSVSFCWMAKALVFDLIMDSYKTCDHLALLTLLVPVILLLHGHEVNQLIWKVLLLKAWRTQGFYKKAFGNIQTAKAGAVAQKDLFERWRLFFFYKPGEANSSWLTAALCAVCAACILSTWFYSSFFHFRVYLYFCLGRFSIPFFTLVHLKEPF